MALRYKTRANSSPQGKPRVYFCCHPADFDRCFSEISKDILDLQNCAVYYDTEEPAEGEMHALELQQMQLFVMPVTTRLLTTENQAIADFRFAAEHHIPVLPLMQESGLAEIFNRKCGDLQFLDKHQQDPTAIPYQQKLEKYLSAVLIGDALAAKIRAAFDGYIFLSYRKKDRAYAQELMRYIHQNDFCRDLAIWYDEFLTPGEDFNDAIQTALEKCGLFALLVTPNLVNEPNYIQRVEYPMAKATGKPILPLEMVATDVQCLQEGYAGLPEIVDARNETALRGTLLEATGHLLRTPQSADPEHLYYMGLAYLSGVDVEVDHTRALQLLTTAAQSDLPQAMEKLAEMYHEGIGVSRSYETSIQWLEKLADAYEKRNQKDPEQNLTSYFGVLRRLGSAWHEFGNEEKAMETMAFLLKLCNTYKPYLQPEIYALFAAPVHSDLGACMLYCGKLRDASAQLRKAVELYEFAMDDSNQDQIQPLLGMVYAHLSLTWQRLGRSDLAEEYSVKAAVQNEASAHSTGHSRDRLTLATSYVNNGHRLKEAGEEAAAQESLEKALELLLDLSAERSSPEVQLSLITCRNMLAELFWTQELLEQAREQGNQALRLCLALQKDLNTADVLDQLATSYFMLARILFDLEQEDTAFQYNRKAIEVYEELAARFQSPIAHHYLSICHSDRGEFYQRQGDYESARDHYLKALECYQSSNYDLDNPETKEMLVTLLSNVSVISFALKDYDSARTFLEIKIELCFRIFEDSQDPADAIDLAKSFHLLGQLCREMEDLDAAARAYDNAVALYEELVDQNCLDEEELDMLALSHYGAGLLCRNKGDLEDAESHYTRVWEIRQFLAKREDSPETRFALAKSSNNLGNLYVQLQDYEQARAYTEEAAALLAELFQDSGSMDLLEVLTAIQDDLADICLQMEDLEAAEFHWRKHLGLLQYKARETEEDEDWAALAESLIRVGKALQKPGYLRDSWGIWKRLSKESEMPEYCAKRIEEIRKLLGPQ